MMERWKLSYEEYGRLPAAVHDDMLIVMSVEAEVAAARAAKDAK